MQSQIPFRLTHIRPFTSGKNKDRDSEPVSLDKDSASFIAVFAISHPGAWRKSMEEILKDIHKKVNEEVNKFSKLHSVVFHPTPFEKTPTKKIKRFLYT